MAVAIDATAGGASANSYVTLAEAETYIEGRLNVTLWDAAADDTKNRALVEAAIELDVLKWQGRRTTSTQAMQWPRQWVTNPDDPTLDYFSETAVPERVKTAQMELALQFVKAGATDVAALDATDGVIRKKVDVLEYEYADHGRRTRGLKRYPRVWNHIRVLVSGSAVTIPIVRG